jgi:hypothetical protein
MRIRGFLLGATAIALSASLVPGGVAHELARPARGHAGVTQAASISAETARNSRTGPGPGDTVYTAPWPETPIVTAVYIYQPASAVTPAPLSAAEACADFGQGCTDEQLCDLWGINCSADPQAGATATPATSSDASAAVPP